MKLKKGNNMIRWIKNICNLSSRLDYFEKEIKNLRAGIDHINTKDIYVVDDNHRENPYKNQE